MESESLAEGNGSLGVSGMATCDVEVLMVVSRLGKQVCLNALVLQVGFGVQKCDCLRGPSGRESEGSVVSVQIA